MNCVTLGDWPSGLRRTHGVREIASSNLASPTRFVKQLQSCFYGCRDIAYHVLRRFFKLPNV